MILIDKKGVTALRERVARGEELERCRETIKKMIEIKDTHQWRADYAVYCVGWALQTNLGWEVKLLRDALWALEDGKTAEAAAKLDDFIKIME